MKLLKYLVILLVMFIVSQADAISLQGLLHVRVLSNTHVHVATTPIRIYSITVTPTASNGFGLVIQTNSALQDNAYSSTYRAGEGYITGRETYIKADLYGATANSSYQFTYEDGINVDENTFVSATNANVDIYYKAQ